MAKKTATPPKAAAKQDDMDDDVRNQPWVKNRNNKSAATPAAAPAPAPAAPKSKYAGIKPASMTDEEYEATLAKLNPPQKTEATSEAKEAKRAAKAAKTAKAEQPADTFKLSPWADEAKIGAKQARVVARANKKLLEPLYVGGQKYLFKNSDKAKVEKIIRDGLAALSGKKKVKTSKKAPAPKIPPPSETIFSGDAKKTKSAAPAPHKSAKEVARAEGKKAVRDLKKQGKKVTKVTAKPAKKKPANTNPATKI